MKRYLNFFSLCLLIILGAASILFSSCSNDDEPEQNPVTTSDGNVVVMEPSIVSQCLQSISNDGTLTFNGLPGDKTPEAGDIICSGITGNAPYGFLYRVKKVSAKNGNTIIETTEASLEEAIENADFSQSINLDEHIAGVFDADGNPMEYSVEPAAMRSSTGTKGEIEQKIKIPINPSIKTSDNTSISLSGSMTITNALEFEMKIENNQLKHLKLAYTTSTAVTATVAGELKGSYQFLKDRQIGSFKMTPITVFCGPIPVVVVPEIAILLQGELEGTLKGEYTLFDTESSVTAGMEYDGKKVSPILQENRSEAKPLAERIKVSLSGAVKITVEPAFSFLLYSNKDWSVGVSVGVYGRLSLNTPDESAALLIENLTNSSRYGINPYLALHLGADIELRGRLKLFKKGLEYEASFPLFEKELARGSIFPRFSDVNVSTLQSASATADTPEGVLFNFILPVSQYGICYGENPLPSIETDKYNNMGAMPAVWTLSNAPTAYIALEDIDEDKTYYVCAYFKNMFGTFYSKVTKYPEDIDNGKIKMTSTASEVEFKISGTGTATIKWGDETSEVISLDTGGSFYRHNNNNKGITITGDNITGFTCLGQQLTSLVVACNTLIVLVCHNNRQLTGLNLSNCTALERLDCADNQLTSLNLSHCSALKILNCNSNQLTILDLSHCTALERLQCADNQLTFLDLSNNCLVNMVYYAGLDDENIVLCDSK